MPRDIIYRTPATDLRVGFTIIREDNRRVKVEKVYAIGDKVFVRDNSGTIGAEYPKNYLFIVVSDN